MEYVGEHLLPGQLGHFSVVLSFVAALLSFFSYFLATQARSKTDFPVTVDRWMPNWKLVGISAAVSAVFFLLAAVVVASKNSAWNVPFIDSMVDQLAGVSRQVRQMAAEKGAAFADIYQRELQSTKNTIGALFGVVSLGFAVAAFFRLFSPPVMYLLDRFRLDDSRQEGWRNLGRMSFLVHGIATLAIIGSLFFILTKKYYEYQYAWSNISDDLPFRYTFSAFWKEQQGSFLLWTFWHIALALIVVIRGGRWEGPVMSMMMLANAVIASMILGLYFGDTRLGASPFDLLRHSMDAPIFSQPDYLSKISGNGLNPLLQNYWMTIHPPTLFLGFASTIMPFSYAAAGLWLRSHKDWLRPALRWSLFSGAILGLGILMGGAWAYEALSFGGYWAWDPVENTSLVPWITLVAGIHCNLVARSTGHSIRAAYGFYLATFLLILYSTYLTRSGILGDSSVHAFTEMGLSAQLILFIFLFTFIGFVPWTGRWMDVPQVMATKLVKNQKADPAAQTPEGSETADQKTSIEVPVEEATGSREFWMFVGALVLFFSAILITAATSLPVWNKIVQGFIPKYVGAALSDPVAHHNRYQLWIAVFIGLLTGVAQWLRYGERNWKGWTKKFTFHTGIALAGAGLLTALNLLWLNAHAWQFYILLFASMFTVVANADYIVAVIKGNLKLAGSAISHLGFGILILGVLGTGLNKRWISSNVFAMDGLIEGANSDDLKKNVLLLKEAPMPMRDGFEATYVRDTMERQTRTFTVKIRQLDSLGNAKKDSFTVFPNVMYDRKFSKIVAQNPSTQHYLTHDIFTLVAALPRGETDQEFAKAQQDSVKYQSYETSIGDTIFTKEHFIVVEGLTKRPQHPQYQHQDEDLAFGLLLTVHTLNDPKSYAAQPVMYIRPGEGGYGLPADVNPLRMKIRLGETAMQKILKTEEELQFENLKFKTGQEQIFHGYKIKLLRPEREVNHPNYTAQPGDIGVTAVLEVTAPDGRSAEARPVYLIRGNQPFSLKDELPQFGLHVNFANIDPNAEEFTVGVALANEEQRKIPVEIAENVTRSDYIVLEAIVFPGINLVWAGSLLMLLGLAVSLRRRFSNR